ncbi:MAG: RNA 3'-terminal phosphate cyclase, partial [Candidatus Hodarchaeota archaeon]
MIEIDGSYGEGGGQILRTSVSLSALTMEPVRISRIRTGRPKPGLKRQHLVGIELLSRMVNAETMGLEIGSTTIEFIPRKRKGGEFSYDVGTAGSISLILQAALPTAVFAPEPVKLALTGGTDVSWSPPIDYMRDVFVHNIQKMGPRIKILLNKRGHYPRGGGRVECEIQPVTSISRLDSVQFGKTARVCGVSHCVRLPGHIAERQATAAEDLLRKQGILNIEITRESYAKNEDKHLGPGTGLVLWAESDLGWRVGYDQLGARGKRAEDVG